jgi:hypothetical protein
VCAGTLAAVRYLVDKADIVYPQWLGVRFSYGGAVQVESS